MPTAPYDPKRSHPVFPLFCPCPECPYYQDLDNVITKAGTYWVQGGTERRQRLYCQAGQHRFSESAYSPLFRHHGSLKEVAQPSGKFQRRDRHVTPGMKMGLTAMPLDWRHLIAAPIPQNAHQFTTSSIL